MTILIGIVLGAGILLCASVWLWPPRSASEERAKRTGRFRSLLAEAGFAHASPSGPIAISILGALIAGDIVFLVTALPAVALLAALAAAYAPFAYLRTRRLNLIRKRRALWPDVCDLLIASVRAGMSLPDSVATLSQHAPVSLRPAFERCARDIRASGHFDSAMARLKDSLADAIADRIIETLRMARQVGGTELTSVLGHLSSSVRADVAIRTEIEARQSWTRGAAVLGAIAPWVVLGMLSLRPEGAAAYSSVQGIMLIVAGAVVSAIAFRIMLRLGRLPEPQRWFA